MLSFEQVKPVNRFVFKFILRACSDEPICDLILPSVFEVMTESDVLMTTQLAISYFSDAPIFLRAAASKDDSICFVSKGLEGESASLILSYDMAKGYSFSVDLSDKLSDTVGIPLIAKEILNIFLHYEQDLLNIRSNNAIITQHSIPLKKQ